MKKQEAKKRGKKASQWKLFRGVNYRLFLAGISFIIIGYILMMQGPHDSFLSLHLSPVMLVLGYCVLIPLSILYRPKLKKGD